MISGRTGGCRSACSRPGPARLALDARGHRARRQGNLERLEPQDPDPPVPIYHGSPQDPVWEYVTEAGQARAALEGRRAPLTLIGHTHIPFAWCLRTDGTLESVGVPPAGAGSRSTRAAGS